VTLRNAAAPFDGGLLHPIVKKLDAGQCKSSLFSSALIRAVVWYKWHWARQVILAEFLIFMFWLVSFLVHASVYEPYELEHGFWHFHEASSGERVALVCSLISTIFTVPFTYMCICEIFQKRKITQWIIFWNIFDLLAQVFQFVCFAIYFFGISVAPNTYACLLGSQTVLLVLKIQYFAR